METISAQKIKEKKDKGDDFVLIDVLPKEKYESQHLPGAINIPVNEIEDRIKEEVPEKDKEIVVYCANTKCQASPKAAEKLEDLGYTDVKDFEEGLAGWQEAGYEFE